MKKTKKLILLFGVGLAVLMPLFSLFPMVMGRASAVVAPPGSGGTNPTTSDQVETQLRSMLYLRGFADCMSQNIPSVTGGGRFHTIDHHLVSGADATNWKFFDTGETVTGLFGDSDGAQKCTDSSWVQNAASLWGIDSSPITAICSIGFSAIKDGKASSGVDDCLHTTGDVSFAVTDKNKAITQLKKYINQQYYKTNSSDWPDWTDPERYLLYRYSFINECGASADDSITDQDIGVDPDHKIKMTNPDGTTTNFVTKGSLSKPDKNVYIQNNLDGKKISCKDMVTNANMYAAAYGGQVTDGLPTDLEDSTNLGGSGSIGIDSDCGGISLSSLATPGGFIKSSIDWLTCAMAGSLSAMASGMDDFIATQLCVNETEIFSGSTATCSDDDSSANSANGFYTAWNTFRILALGMIVIAGLMMIISQAMGFEIFDAYTIKKTLPRILIAGVAISLSWKLLEFMVTLSNGLGIGVRALIYAPFIHAGVGGVDFGVQQLSIGSLLAVGGLLAFDALGLLSFVATAALAILVAFLVIVIRNILVILLIIVAPLAIACYALPNTEKYTKIWWEWLSRALLMFPLITAFIAVGHVFASISAARGGTINSFIALAAYVAPYFLIPLTFRLAGGAISTIGGLANDRSRGSFDRLKKFRQGRLDQNTAAMKQGFDRTRIGSSLKAGRQRQLARRSAWASGGVGVGGIGTAGYESSLETSHLSHLAADAAEAIKNNPSMAANDDANVIARNATSRSDFIAQYNNRFKGRPEGEAQNQLTALEQAYGTNMGTDQMKHTAASAALSSNASTDSVAERAQFMRDAVNNHVMSESQAAGLVKQSGSLLSSASYGDIAKAARSNDPTKGGISDHQLLENASRGFSPQLSHRMRVNQAKEHAQEVFRQADEAAAKHGTGSDEFARAVADAAGMHDMMNGMTPDVREAYATELNGQAVGGKYVREWESVMENGTAGSAAITAIPAVPGFAGQAAVAAVPSTSANGAYLDRRKSYSAAAAAASGGAPGAAGGPPPAGGGPAGGAGGAGGAPSDARLKRNIKQLGYIANIPVYRFCYLWSDTVYVGVMAQDILNTHPPAVHINNLGYYEVDYGVLGFDMMTLEEWQQRTPAEFQSYKLICK